MGMVKVFNILNGIFDKGLNLVENYTFDPGPQRISYATRRGG